MSWKTFVILAVLAAGLGGFLVVDSYWLTPKREKSESARGRLWSIEPKDVEINAMGNMLTIRGERKLVHTTKEFDFFNQEIKYGRFERTLQLPEGILPEKLVAEYHNGVLEITAPVTVAALPHKVEIKTAPIAKQVTA